MRKDLSVLLTHFKPQLQKQWVVSFNQWESTSHKRQPPGGAAARTPFPWLPAATIFFTELSIANFSNGLSGKQGRNRWKAIFYLSCTEPQRTFTKGRDVIRKSNYVTPMPWGHLPTALHQHLDEGGRYHFPDSGRNWNSVVTLFGSDHYSLYEEVEYHPSNLSSQPGFWSQALPLKEQYLLWGLSYFGCWFQ